MSIKIVFSYRIINNRTKLSSGVNIFEIHYEGSASNFEKVIMYVYKRKNVNAHFRKDLIQFLKVSPFNQNRRITETRITLGNDEKNPIILLKEALPVPKKGNLLLFASIISRSILKRRFAGRGNK
jgi:hypothetical protein